MFAPVVGVYGLPLWPVTDTQAPYPQPFPWRIRGPRDTQGFVSPAVRRRAAAQGIDPDTVAGTGAAGRVTVADLASATVVRGDEIVPFNNVRKRAAKLLVASKHTSPHTLCAVAADYSGVEVVRAAERVAWGEREGFSLTYLPFIARALVDALREFPLMNAAVDGESLVVRREVNLGIAVDLDYQGLVVPVIRGADGLRLRALARAVYDLATRARSKRLTPDDLAGGTFTITNPGASGTWLSFPIINQPQVGILATDGVSKQVVVDDEGKLTIAPVGRLCLTFDHRALDGSYAGAFVARVKEIVETRDWATEI